MTSVKIEKNSDTGEYTISGSLDADDVNAMREFGMILADAEVAALLEKKGPKGLMKDYCTRCYGSGRKIDFRAWSVPQAIARGIAECGGSCQVSKGKCEG